jgi:hypothetical protein
VGAKLQHFWLYLRKQNVIFILKFVNIYILIIKMAAKKSKTTETCPHCAAAEGTGYSLWDANDPFIQSFKPFRQQNKHKNVELVHCPDCDQAWVLYAYGENNQKVDLSCLWGEAALEQFLNWSKTPFNASPAQLKALAKIGGLNGDGYGNGSACIEVPCKVILTDGREKEHCLLRFTNLPPKELVDNESTFWITAVDKISASQNALPYKARYLSSIAEEVRNSYAPSLIKSPDGKIFILNWTNHFFATKSHKGAKFTAVENLDPFNIPPSQSGDYKQALPLEVVIVYADWAAGLENQLLPQ